MLGTLIAGGVEFPVFQQAGLLSRKPELSTPKVYTGQGVPNRIQGI